MMVKISNLPLQYMIHDSDDDTCCKERTICTNICLMEVKFKTNLPVFFLKSSSKDKFQYSRLSSKDTVIHQDSFLKL